MSDTEYIVVLETLEAAAAANVTVYLRQQLLLRLSVHTSSRKPKKSRTQFASNQSVCAASLPFFFNEDDW